MVEVPGKRGISSLVGAMRQARTQLMCESGPSALEERMGWGLPEQNRGAGSRWIIWPGALRAASEYGQSLVQVQKSSPFLWGKERGQ